MTHPAPDPGTLSPATWQDRLIRRALQDEWAHVHEQGGENRGPEVDRYLALCDLDPAGNDRLGYPWCAAAVSAWGHDIAGDQWPLPLSADCDKLALAAKAKNVLSLKPARGAIYLRWGGTVVNFHHTGVLIRLAGGMNPPSHLRWDTVSGNTNDDGSRDGYGVFERNESFHVGDAFIWWWEAIP